MKVYPISQPLPGERIVDVIPKLEPNVAAGWLRRLNLVTGRNLSDAALQAEQAERSARLALRGQMLSPGVVTGLEADAASRYLYITPGIGITANGEDIIVPQALRVAINDLHVYAPVTLLEGGLTVTDSSSSLAARKLSKQPLGELIETGIAANLPKVGILVLQPIVAQIVGNSNALETCELDTQDNAFIDEQQIDGCRLILYTWPSEWLMLPEPGERWRNRLAYTIFNQELKKRLPWEEVGVAIALIAFDDNWTPQFVDRHAVARLGGKPKSRTPLIVNAGNPFIWQARIQQFAEQLTELDLETTPLGDIAPLFRYLPPVGLLPKNAIAPREGKDNFFPSYYAVEAAPVPLEQLDVVFQASASLLPFDLFTPTQVQVLIPVPQNWYEPNLLKTEAVAPEFQQAINRFATQRTEWLYRRELVREKAAAIIKAISGQAPKYPPQDPDGLPDEDFKPFSSTKVLQSATGGGTYSFKYATETLKINSSDRLTLYVYLDPQATRLEVRWLADNNLLRSVFWQNDTPEEIANGTNFYSDYGLSPLYLGSLPDSSQWVRLEIPANLIGLEGATLQGMTVIASDGQVVWGHAGKLTLSPESETVWVGNNLPAGAEIIAKEGWSWVNADQFTPSLTQKVKLELKQEQIRRQKPFSSTKAFVSNLAKEGSVYALKEATVGLSINRGDRLTAYVYLDPNHLPNRIELWWMTDNSDRPLHRAYWGFPSNWGQDFSSFRGPLPKPGRWIRLEVPANALGLAGANLRGIAFVIDGGRAAWAHAGKLEFVENLPVETVWVGNNLPPGVKISASQGWRWSDLTEDSTPFDEPLSPLLQLKSITEDDYEIDVNSDGKTSVIPLKRLKNKLSETTPVTELYELETLGLEKFIPFLEDKVKKANTKIEFGYARVKTDSFRITQYLLANDVAARLTPAPVLADAMKEAKQNIIARNDVNVFIDAAQKTKPTPQQIQPLLERRQAFALRNQSLFERFEPSDQSADIQDTSAESTAQSSTTEATAQAASSESATSANQAQFFNFAARLQEPKVVETKTFAVASKYEVVKNLAELDINLQELEIPGIVEGKKSLTFKDINPEILGNILNDRYDFVPQGVDEATFLAAGIRTVDDIVATLQVVENQVKGYRLAIELCQETLKELKDISKQADRRLQTIAQELAEARHDLSVARALLAEEQARVKAINDRRDRILSDHVSFLVFHRPRSAETIVNTPVRTLDPGITTSPVPACLGQNVRTPSELRTMVDLLRDLPVQWFKYLPPLLHKFDRLEILYGAIQTAKLRANFSTPLQQITPTNSRLGEAITKVVTAQQQLAKQYRSLTAQVDLSLLAGQTWKGIRDRAETLLSLGDLIDGDRGRIDVSQQVTQELENIARVTTCLYANFGEVLPAIRLEWAEILSQYDTPINLQNLTVLPRWGEISFLERREMQTLVDWLYQRIDERQIAAISLMDDLVRICILLASHAPVNQIISGRVVQPTTVSQGSRVELAVDLTKVQIGMQVLVYSATNQVVAHAVVEDLATGQAAARITRTFQPKVQLSENTRVQFTNTTNFRF